ncbi:MAG: ribosome-associated translation inhibitor RaiA [Ignavibacteriaceae bacterium]
MNVSITSRKFKARETLKDFINSEVVSLERFYDNILSADVILSYLNSRDSIKSAEIILKIPGMVLKAADDSDDYKKSVSSAVEKLSRQLKKMKTKKFAHAR